MLHFGRFTICFFSSHSLSGSGHLSVIKDHALCLCCWPFWRCLRQSIAFFISWAGATVSGRVNSNSCSRRWVSSMDGLGCVFFVMFFALFYWLLLGEASFATHPRSERKLKSHQNNSPPAFSCLLFCKTGFFAYSSFWFTQKHNWPGLQKSWPCFRFGFLLAGFAIE